ncbi:hypothetical protein RBA41_29275 [Massilia sp. CCM 9210]|uniref:hypothetical protein n=1 Tax=Massilia scottii TaxID=3057166 RepID=UPI002796ADD6|nr:hypothetical protein [Massilia sp. CCM 9210]MDQ1817406.1 hypothetical protein [Massilia sp. CCM 9210]
MNIEIGLEWESELDARANGGGNDRDSASAGKTSFLQGEVISSTAMTALRFNASVRATAQ